MRVLSVLTFLLVLFGSVSAALASPVDPDSAVMDAPLIDDITLLQLDSNAHTTTSTVSTIESQLAAALNQQASIEAELKAQTDADVGAEAEVDTESVAEAEAQAEEKAAAEAKQQAEHAAEAEAEDKGASELAAELEAQAASEVEAEMGASSEASTESETEGEAMSEAELDAAAEAEAQAETEAETEAENSILSESSSSATSVGEGENKVTGTHVVDTASGDAVVAQATKREEPIVKIGKQFPVEKPKTYQDSVVRIERSEAKGTPDVVHLKNGNKLYKSWIVDPKKRLEPAKPKPVLKHSRERVMNRHQAKRFSVLAKYHPRKPKASRIRKAFLKLNPKIQKRALRKRAYSPSAALALAFRAGKFPHITFDPPTHSITTNHVTQHLTVRHHNPTVRQRAEVSALRAATRTLRRINAKRREFKRAIRALQVARAHIQDQIHKHHVTRAIRARKDALRAARRAAWSGLLKSRRLRKTFLKQVARALRKGHLTGAARKAAIIALLKRNITAKERKRLHAIIKGGSSRSKRHLARGVRHAARRLAKSMDKTKKEKSKRAKRNAAKKAKKSGKKATKRVKATPITSGKSAAATVRVRAAPVKKATSALKVVRSSGKASGSSAPAVSEKDQKAIDALIARIHAAINHPDTPRRQTVKAVAPKKAKLPTVRAVAKKPAVLPKVRAVAKKASINPKATPRFAELDAAEALAAQAEAEALAELDVETEVDEPEDLVMQTEAQVQALTESTDEFLQEHGL